MDLNTLVTASTHISDHGPSFLGYLTQTDSLTVLIHTRSVLACSGIQFH
jgi:hypothetical protein